MELVENENLHSIGERCFVQNFKGTIRYVGEVPPTEGLWYGVEWDTDRGKNDGMVHGHRYFTCSPNHGSFVRIQKLHFGHDALSGFRKHYGMGKLDFEETSIVLNENTSRETVIEMVGFDEVAQRQSNYETLKDADCSGAQISHASQFGLEYIAPNLKSLNLRGNLISSLKEVKKIAGNLKKLNVLNISENRINDWNNGGLEKSVVFQQLTCIYINKMQITWNEVIITLKMLPNIKEVHSCMNQIKDIRYDPALEKIEVLNLQGNQIDDWEAVQNLGRLEKLQKLILNSNQLKVVKIENDQSGVKRSFQSLTSLSLSDNLIDDWKCVDVMNEFPSITEVRFRNNPVCEGKTGFELRQELISRLANVAILNGSEVIDRERKTAELAYVKLYAPAFYSAKRENTFNEFLLHHPRYESLANIHGMPEEQLKKTKSLKDNLIEVDIQCPDCESKESTKKLVPVTMTVQQLKGILQRLYKIPTSKQKISYFDTKNTREINLDDNMKQLCFYSIVSGDIVYLRW